MFFAKGSCSLTMFFSAVSVLKLRQLVVLQCSSRLRWTLCASGHTNPISWTKPGAVGIALAANQLRPRRKLMWSSRSASRRPIDRWSCSCANYRRGTVAAAGFLDGFRIGNGTTLSRNPVQFSATIMLFSG